QQGGHHRAARPCGSTAASAGRRLPAAAVGNRVRFVPAPIPGARSCVSSGLRTMFVPFRQTNSFPPGLYPRGMDGNCISINYMYTIR
ncbi:MAG: hypothetical protein K6A95_08780, partial [Bacteroidales bacterium]|nr:hypothetical protein [Bacteroidales bacterium]